MTPTKDIPNVRVRPLHPEAQRGAEPVEPGGGADLATPKGATGPGGTASATAEPYGGG